MIGTVGLVVVAQREEVYESYTMMYDGGDDDNVYDIEEDDNGFKMLMMTVRIVVVKIKII